MMPAFHSAQSVEDKIRNLDRTFIKTSAGVSAAPLKTPATVAVSEILSKDEIDDKEDSDADGLWTSPRRKQDSWAQDCDCGQEEKVIVFMGRTQNGKSSTIQSLLGYGGRVTAKQAEKVHIGRNTASCTKHVSSYYANMAIDRHVLLDEEDQPVKATADNVWDLRPQSRSTGNHVHLRFVDTPGLNDSAKPHKIIDERAQLRQPVMKSVDEQHKVLILQELAKIPKIHAVCIVLKPHALSGSVQEDVRQYLDLLKLASLGERIHFVYTHINVDTMFDQNILKSPQVTEEQFGLCEEGAKQHFHFFLNNEPDEEISQHFTDHTLAAMLDSFRRQQGRSTSGLVYPKCTAHKLMDQDIEASLNSRLEDARHDHLRHLQRGVDAGNDLIENHQLYRAQIAAAEAAEEIVKEWDTEELEEMSFLQLTKGDIPFVRRDLVFNMSTDFPIREWEHATPGNDERWAVYSELGGTHFTAILEGGRGYAVSDWVRLYGWKKDIHKGKIEDAVVRGEAARACASDYLEKMKQAANTQQDADDEANKASIVIEQAEKALAPFSRQTFSVSDMARFSSNITIENLLHYSEMWPCELKFSWESLKWHRNQREVLFELFEQWEGLVDETLVIERKIRDGFDLFDKQMSLVGAENDAAERRLKQDISALSAALASISDDTVSLAPFPAAAAEEQAICDTVSAELASTVERNQTTARLRLAHETQALEETEASRQAPLQELQRFLSETAQDHEEWCTKLDRMIHLDEIHLRLCKTRIPRLFKQDFLDLGEYTLLRVAIEEHGEESYHPFLILSYYMMEQEYMTEVAAKARASGG